VKGALNFVLRKIGVAWKIIHDHESLQIPSARE